MTTGPDRRVLLDTNVLVYASDSGSPYHAACAALQEKALRKEIEACISPQILYEYFAGVTNPNTAARPLTIDEALSDVERLAQAYPLIFPPADTHVQVVQLVRTTGLAARHVHDVHLAATMIGNGVSTIYTYDTKSSGKIPGLTVLQP